MDRTTTTASSTGRFNTASSGMGSTFRAIAQGTSVERRQRSRTTPPEAVQPGVSRADHGSGSWRLAV